jgi:hypothetical protein
VAPNPYYTEEIAAQCMQTIFLPTIRAMQAEGRPFQGCLYFGLMLTPDGPKVIEYNCRFGDPETQVVLPLLESDLFAVMRHCADGTLHQADIRFSSGSACCVVVASGGYPKKYETGFEITLPEEKGMQIYVAGAKLRDGKLLTSAAGCWASPPRRHAEGGRRKSLRGAELIKFENAYYRATSTKSAQLYGKALRLWRIRSGKYHKHKRCDHGIPVMWKKGRNSPTRPRPLPPICGAAAISALTVCAFYRYDVEHIEPELFEYCKGAVFSDLS